jgi:hypothetical protein
MKKKVVSLFLLLELVGVPLAHNCLDNDVGSFDRFDLVGELSNHSHALRTQLSPLNRH